MPSMEYCPLIMTEQSVLPKSTKIVTSVIWSIAARWSSKFIGMINIIVLARLLSPEDFGIVAMASIFLGVLESMTEVGIHLFVIRQESEDPRLFHTGWTVGFIQGCIIAGVLALAAPFIADFYNQQVLADIIYCLAFIRILKGLQSFGVFIAQKQLKFHIDFKVTFYTRISYMLATIGFALYIENYWAIVWGQLMAAIFGIIFSYSLHPYRPKFMLYQWRDMLLFSKSTLLMSVGRFFNNQMDVAVIGRVSSADYLGQYHVASNIGALFTKQLLAPLIKGLIPNIALLKQQADFDKTLRLTISFAVYLFLPIGFGLAMLSTEVVLILLGDNWLSAIEILAWLSLYSMTAGIMMFISEQFLIVLKHEALSNKLMWFRNALLIFAIGITLYFGDATDIPRSMFLAALMSLPMIIWAVCKRLKFSIVFLLTPWWPACLATLNMVLLIHFMPWPDLSVWLLIIMKIISAALSYVLTLMVLFWLRKYPENGPEKLIMNRLSPVFSSKINRSENE